MITWPDSITSIHSQTSGFASSRKARISEQLNKLNELDSPVFTESDLAQDAGQLSSLRSEILDLHFNGWTIALTPYQYDIGFDNTLSPENAQELGAQKLLDQYDAIDGSYGVVFWVGTNTESELATRLSDIVSVLDFPTWHTAAALARQHSGRAFYETQTAIPAKFPYWINVNYSQANPVSTSTDAVINQVIFAESVDSENKTTIERLGELAARSEAHIDSIEQSITDIIDIFSGDVGAIRLQGDIDAMAQQLRQANFPYYPHSTMLIVISETEMTFLFEMVGL